MFLDEGGAVDNIIDAVGGEDVLEFQAVDARGVRLFHIEIVRVVIEHIGDAHPERLGVAEVAEINAVHQQVFMLGDVTPEFQLGVDAGEPGPQFGEDIGRIHHGEPKRFAAARVFVGHRTGEATQFPVYLGNVAQAVKTIQILPQR